MLGLPGREYFINPGDFQYREAYLNLMLSVTEILGASVDVALRDMTEVLHFEKQLSRVGIGGGEVGGGEGRAGGWLGGRLS